jgi:signal transduction histidine kinase
VAVSSSPYRFHLRLMRAFVGKAPFALLCFIGMAEADIAMANPIGRVARLFNPELVKLESRVEFLNQQKITLAVHEDRALDWGMGCRGVRQNPSDPDPSVTVDLGAEYPIESLYLVPLQQSDGERGRLFPRGFRIELSGAEDFSGARVLYDHKQGSFPETDGKPVKFAGQGAVARYVRLTVTRGDIRGESEVFGLAEMVVISDGYPVSFGAKVSAVGALRVANQWYPEALTDGRMPLGTWQGGKWLEGQGRGELVEAAGADEQAVWEIDLGESRSLDSIMLFPYDLRGALDAGILSERIEIQGMEEGGEFRSLASWDSPVKGAHSGIPLFMDLGGARAMRVRVIGVEPSRVGDKLLHGLSEIELWSGKRNVSKGLPVMGGRHGRSAETKRLTDGYGCERQIIPVGSWLNQLHERWRVEKEIEALQPMRSQMAAESELNATWGSAMMLGLTFLIPVFVVERRRLISKNQIDQLRKRIASDLHDDIGSNLGSISMIARTARKDLVRLQGPEEVAEDLGEVESIARESSLAMRDIVWLLERQQDSIGDLVHRMRETAGRLLREFEYTIECESSKSAAKLSLDAKRHLFLFYKEAIHNILKHSKATRVSIRLWDEGEKLALEVVDNGQGLPRVIENGKEITKPVRKLDERARVLEGELSVSSAPGKGTRTLLTVKRSLLIAAPSMK